MKSTATICIDPSGLLCVFLEAIPMKNISDPSEPSAKTEPSSVWRPTPWSLQRRAARYFGLGILVIIFFVGIIFYLRPLWVVDQGIALQFALDGVHSEYAQVGPYRVHYFVGGRGTPLLLIHGLGEQAQDWATEIPTFVHNGFRVYAIDLLGCGSTDRPDIAYTVQQQADMVRQFLDVLQIHHADVVGWSLGGWVALKLTLKHPELVQRLVLDDSAGLKFSTALSPEIFMPTDRASLARLQALLVVHPTPIPAFLARDILRRIHKNSWVIQRTIHSALTDAETLDGQLQQIHAPVLLAWGAQDALIPPSVGKAMHQQIPQSVLEFYEGCGHTAPAICARRIAPNAVKFLQSQPAMSGGTFSY